MNFAAMSLITTLIFIFLLVIGYSVNYFSLEKVYTDSKVTTTSSFKNSNDQRLHSYSDFLKNYFIFGLAFAGCCSLIGSILN